MENLGLIPFFEKKFCNGPIGTTQSDYSDSQSRKHAAVPSHWMKQVMADTTLTLSKED